MGLFRRRQETLNEQLLREAGLDPDQGPADPPTPSATPSEPEPEAPAPTPRRHGSILTYVGTGTWDAVATARAAGLAGNQVEFTTLPNGDVIVELEQGDGDLSPLADAVEQSVEPPYRAVASREDGDLWTVGARRIEVAEFELADGEAVELVVNEGGRRLLVDGEPSEAEVPEIVRLGEQKGPDYTVEAQRIDGDFWEVLAAAL